MLSGRPSRFVSARAAAAQGEVRAIRAAREFDKKSRRIRAPRLIHSKKWLEELLGMKLMGKDGEQGATGYILMWLLGIPIPILLLIFFLRGCT